MTHLMATYPSPPVHFVSGSGCRLVDDGGRRYLDLLAGLAVTSLGHAHPAVAEAICHQASTLVHVSNLFASGLNEEVALLLDQLVGDGEPSGGKVFFTNSGAEANECAIKLARRFGGRGRYAVVSAFGSFHGRTLATLHATGQPAKHEPFAPMPDGFRHVAYGDLEALAAAADPTVVAAILLEVIEAEGGVIVPPAGYLPAVRRLCDERGILLILDEVQTGLARTGRWFGCHHESVRPDVLTNAKALGNGMPVGACWARADVAEVFVPGDHGSTFGGQPLAMAAARATLETLRAIDAPARARARGEQLNVGLSKMPGVRGTRGLGLLIGVMLEEGIEAPRVVADALEHGLIVNAPLPDVLRLAPPLVISPEECDEGLELLAASIERVASGAGEGS